MPYVHIQIPRKGASAEQKAEPIHGATEFLVRVLDKDPMTTFVVIEDVDLENWVVGGESVTTLRRPAKGETT